MFIKIVPNSKGKKGTYFCYLVESYRENGRIKHRTLRSFGLLEEDQVPFLKAMYVKKKPRLVYDDETCYCACTFSKNDYLDYKLFLT